MFFKAFTGNPVDGAMTADLYQVVPATAGLEYVLTGWAGAEANLDVAGAVFALDFFSGGGIPLSSPMPSEGSGGRRPTHLVGGRPDVENMALLWDVR